MKKFFSLSAFVVVLLASNLSFGRSILPSVVNYGHMAVPGLAGGMSETLVVYANGQVVYRPLQAVFPAPKSIVVGTLSAHTIDRLNRLAQIARKGVIKREGPFAKCFAPASHLHVYQADMAQVLLRKGDMCANGFEVNQSFAAKKLVKFLDALRAKFNVPGGGPGVESSKEINIRFDLDSALEN